MEKENKIIKLKFNTIVILILTIVLFIIGIIIFILTSKQKGLISQKITEDNSNNIHIKKVVTGDSHTIVEDLNGEIWVCGDNESGELGIGNTNSQKYLIKIGQTDTGKKIVFPNKIVAGSSITIIEDKDGEVWVCGSNIYGQLGLGNAKKNITTLTKLEETGTGKKISYPNKIDCGSGFILLEDKEGMIWTCGLNQNGELGVGDKENRSVLTQIVNTRTGKEIIKPNKIELGSSFIIIEDRDGIVWGCGNNSYNQLFVEQKSDYDRLFEIEMVGQHPNKIATGAQHVIIEKTDGMLIGAGRNLYGELTGNEKDTIKYDMEYGNGKKVVNPKEIICKDYTTIIKDDDKQIWVCGYNYGQFGDGGKNETINELTLLNDISNKTFEKINNISLGDSYLIIEDDKSNFWCAGKNDYGQLALGMMDEEDIDSFVLFGKDKKRFYTNDNKNAQMEYKIVKEIPGMDVYEKQRGYKVIEKNGFFYIVVSMGEKPTGGYLIEADKVYIDGDDIHIDIKEEVSLGTVTQAFTYPCEIIQLNKKPNHIIIENQDTGSEFEKIND